LGKKGRVVSGSLNSAYKARKKEKKKERRKERAKSHSLPISYWKK